MILFFIVTLHLFFMHSLMLIGQTTKLTSLILEHSLFTLVAIPFLRAPRNSATLLVLLHKQNIDQLLIIAKVRWICSLLSKLGVSFSQELVIYCNNIGAMNIFANLVFHSYIKNIVLDYHFIRKQVQSGLLRVTRVSFANQLTNELTKPLPCNLLQLLRDKIELSLWSSILRENDKGKPISQDNLYPLTFP